MELTYKDGDISKQDFDEYFKNRALAYAYKLGRITVYDKPLNIQVFGFKAASQNYYVR